MDPGLAKLFQWSIENSSAARSTSATTTDINSTSPDEPATAHPPGPIDPEVMAHLFGGPSDADLMRESMAAITSPDIDLENKLIAFDNLEQLVESIDNANNLEPLGLWTPLITLLSDVEGELRRMAAWCVGTAVQNNEKAQEKALIMGVVPALVKMCKEEKDEGVRRKALYALSSQMRNYQPGTDAAVKALGLEGKVDSADMEAVDGIIEKLRQRT